MSIQPQFPSLTFANGLFIPEDGGDAGLFYYLLDILITPTANIHVRQHEAAHRLFASPDAGAPDFFVLRKFVGISHALLWQLARIARGERYYVSDIRLTTRHDGRDMQVAHRITPRPDLESVQWSRPPSDESPQTFISWLLNRIAAFEAIIDDLWEGLEIIAEIMAIDFADSVDLQSNAWVLRTPDRSPAEQREVDTHKERLLEALYSAWPTHTAERVDTAWRRYVQVADPNARLALLRLCGTSFGGGPSDRNFVIDPLSILEENIELAKTDPSKATLLFGDERRRRTEDGLRSVEFLITQMLVSLDGGPVQGVRSLTEIVGNLVDKIRTAQDPNRADYTGLDRSWLQVNASEGRIETNRHVVNAAAEVSPDLLPRVIVLEIMRQALKLGVQMPCQFCGWQLSAETHGLLYQNGECRIYSGLRDACEWCDIVNTGLSCEHALPAAQQ